MLSQYFRTRRLRAAVRRCQLLLGPQLRRDYGSTNTYTLGQVTQAMRRMKLPAADRELACAAFMSEAAFSAAVPTPTKDYVAHREELQRHAVPLLVSSSFQSAAESSDASAAGIGSHL